MWHSVYLLLYGQTMSVFFRSLMKINSNYILCMKWIKAIVWYNDDFHGPNLHDAQIDVTHLLHIWWHYTVRITQLSHWIQLTTRFSIVPCDSIQSGTFLSLLWKATARPNNRAKGKKERTTNSSNMRNILFHCSGILLYFREEEIKKQVRAKAKTYSVFNLETWSFLSSLNSVLLFGLFSYYVFVIRWKIITIDRRKLLNHLILCVDFSVLSTIVSTKILQFRS